MDENTNVLDEVETLFKKLQSLPDNLREVAFSKIKEKLPSDKLQIERLEKSESDNHIHDPPSITTKKRLIKKQRTIAVNNGVENASSVEHTYESDNSEPEFVIKNVFTSRGRQAKRICYTNIIRKYNKNTENDLKTSSNEAEDIVKTEPNNAGKPNSSASVRKRREYPQKLEDLPLFKLEFVEDEHILSEESFQVVRDGADIHTEVVVGDKCRAKEPAERLFIPKKQNVEGGVSTEETLMIYNGSQDKVDNTISEPIPEKRLVKFKKPKGRSGANFHCLECNFQAHSRTMLDIHVRKHTGEKPHVCTMCGKGFPQSSGLNIHMKRHRGQRDFKCDGCDYRAYTKMDIIRHRTIHTGERNHVCQYCGKAYAKDSTLREHVKSIHERTSQYMCAQCGFTTYRTNNLRVHIRMRHRGEYNNHVCPVCGARVKQKTAFLEHMRAHTGEKPYRCDQCDSSFACLARLTVHRKSIHEPRQFICPDCNKMFQTKHHLLRHKVIHTKERPYACPYCSYTCNTQGNMSKHVKTIHFKPDFSFRKMRAENELTVENPRAVSQEWVDKGQQFTEEYLRALSYKMGQDVTLEDLRNQQVEKQKRLDQEVQIAKMKRMNKVQNREHSYHNNKALQEVPGPEEDNSVDDPTTLIFKLVSDNTTQLVKMSVDPEEKQQLAKMKSAEEGPSEGKPQVIHVETADTVDETQYQAVILASSEEDEGFIPGQVYHIVSEEGTMQLCVGEAGKTGTTLQLFPHEASQQLSTLEKLEDNGEQFMLVDNDNNKEGTVVVFINTNSSKLDE